MKLIALPGLNLSQFFFYKVVGLVVGSCVQLLCKRTVAGMDDNHYGRELFTFASD